MLLLTRLLEGKGGDGCVAFHREKFVPHGPPSGGNGGRGGDVYILPTPGLTTLSSVSPRVRGVAGGQGKGTWMHGRNGSPTIIKVPVGTVVRELEVNDGAHDVWEADDADTEMTAEERKAKIRERRWVHYPGAAEDNLDRDAFLEAERTLYREERQRRMMQRERQVEPLNLDLDAPLPPAVTGRSAPLISPNASTSHVPIPELGYLVAAGGIGGLGNPAFVSTLTRSPKFATRGREGTRRVLALELKILADIGLVGFPNAGKSTLLRALTGGRAQTEVAGYAFTTLNPSVGVVRLDPDGNVLGDGEGENRLVIDDTTTEMARFNAQLAAGELADNSLSPGTARRRDQNALAVQEAFRFTLADNPGLIEHASSGAGLGHTFLRSVERASALVYVVDLSANGEADANPDPMQALRILRSELEAHVPGLSGRARMVLATKCDLLGADGDEESVRDAKDRLARLETFVREEFVHEQNAEKGVRRPLDVVPVSAKYGLNLRRVGSLMRGYVEEANGSTIA